MQTALVILILAVEAMIAGSLACASADTLSPELGMVYGEQPRQLPEHVDGGDCGRFANIAVP